MEAFLNLIPLVWLSKCAGNVIDVSFLLKSPPDKFDIDEQDLRSTHLKPSTTSRKIQNERRTFPFLIGETRETRQLNAYMNFGRNRRNKTMIYQYIHISRQLGWNWIRTIIDNDQFLVKCLILILFYYFFIGISRKATWTIRFLLKVWNLSPLWWKRKWRSHSWKIFYCLSIRDSYVRFPCVGAVAEKEAEFIGQLKI